MSDFEGQAPPAAAPQAGATAPSNPTAGEPQDVSALPEWAQKALREAREDAAKHRLNAKDREALAQKLKGIEDAQLSEQEKLTKRAQELEQKANQNAQELRQERAHREVERQARRLNLIDEETALALVRDRIEYDDAGKPRNVEALLTDLIKDKPFLAAAQGTATPPAQQRPAYSAANPNRGAAAAGVFTTSQIADRKFYEANRDAIMQAYSDGRIIDG